MSEEKCSKCGAEMRRYAVGFPNERVWVKVCTNCIKLKLSNQIQNIDF
jgi:ribosomal protein L32